MASESSALFSNDELFDRAGIDGLENLFSDSHDELFSKGLSIKQAVFYYGETRRSIKGKLLSGEIPAIRLPDTYGRKWRVFPDGVPEQLLHLMPKKLRKNFLEPDQHSRIAESKTDSTLNEEAYFDATPPPAVLQIDDSKPEGCDLKTKSKKRAKKQKKNFGISREINLEQPELHSLSELQSESLNQADLENISAQIESSDTALPEPSFNFESGPAASAVAICSEALESEASAATAICKEVHDLNAPAAETPTAELVATDLLKKTASASALPDTETAAQKPMQTDALAKISGTHTEIPAQDLTDSCTFLSDETGCLPVQIQAIEPLELSYARPPLDQDSENNKIETTGKKATSRYAQLEERISLLDKELSLLKDKNSELESKLSFLEEQLKAVNQTQCHSLNIHKMLLIVPSIVLIVALLIFRFAAQAQVLTL